MTGQINQGMKIETVVELYKIVCEQERHFNEISAKYRFFCTTLVIGALSAVGYLLTNDKSQSMINPSYLAVGVCVFAQVGVFLLWNLDIRVYHRLLDSAFVEGLKLERAYDWLPKMRLKMFPKIMRDEFDNSRIQISKKIRLFYTLSVSICGISSFGLLVASLYDTKTGHMTTEPMPGLSAFILVSSIFTVILICFVHFRSESSIVTNWINSISREDNSSRNKLREEWGQGRIELERVAE